MAGWKEVAAWADVVVSSGAVVAASAAVHQTKKLLRIESDRERDRIVDGEASQARGVTAWVAQEIVDIDGAPVSVGLYLANRSELAIYQLDLKVVVHGRHLRETIQVLPPGDHYLRADLAGGGVRFDFPTPPSMLDHHLRAYTKSDAYHVKSLSFADSAGIRWVRGPGGVLERETA